MRWLVSSLAVTAGLALLPGVAQAQDRGGYPPHRGGLTVSESSLSPGDRFTVSGGGAEPGASVTFTVEWPDTRRLVSLGSTTGADGQFSATLTMPAEAEPGVYTLTASSGGEFLAAMTLRVMTVAGIGGLPFAGATVLPGLAAGAALIVAGGVLLLSLKRRASAV
jgi:hypothetical protein